MWRWAGCGVFSGLICFSLHSRWRLSLGLLTTLFTLRAEWRRCFQDWRNFDLRRGLLRVTLRRSFLTFRGLLRMKRYGPSQPSLSLLRLGCNLSLIHISEPT